MSGSGYVENQSAKGAGQARKPEAYLWSTVEQVLKGRSKRSAPKKEMRSPLRQGTPSSPRGESSKRRGDVVTLFPPQQMQPMYATMPWVPPASDSQFPAWENKGFWMQCYPMPCPPHFQGREAPEDLYLTGLGSRFTTDWVGTNLVRGSTPDRSNRSTPTGQIGLSRGRPKFVQCTKNIASKRRRTN